MKPRVVNNEDFSDITIDAMDSAASAYFDESDTTFIRAQEKVKLKKYKEAIQDFDNLIDQYPGRAILYFNRALAYASFVSYPHYNHLLDDITKCQAAIQDFETALSLKLDLPIIHEELLSMRLQIAETYLAHQSKKEAYRTQAVSEYYNLIDKYPAHDNVAHWLCMIARIHLYKSNYPAAIECYTNILENYRPENGNMHFNRAMSYKDIGNNKAAFYDLIKAYEYHPELIKRIRHYKKFILQTIINYFSGDERIKLLKDYTDQNTVLGKIAYTAREERKCDKSRGNLKTAFAYLNHYEKERDNIATVSIVNSKHFSPNFFKRRNPFKLADENVSELQPLSIHSQP